MDKQKMRSFIRELLEPVFEQIIDSVVQFNSVFDSKLNSMPDNDRLEAIKQLLDHQVKQMTSKMQSVDPSAMADEILKKQEETDGPRP